MRIVISCMMKRCIPVTETTEKFPIGMKVTVEQILGPEEINPKKQVCESHGQGLKRES